MVRDSPLSSAAELAERALRRRAIAGERHHERRELGFSSISSFDEPIEVSEAVEPAESVMTCRDRTSEFGAAVRSLRTAPGVRPVPPRGAPGTPASASLASYSQFMHGARLISKNISGTYSKLEKLALLAKKKSLFDDRPAEIQELTYIIKSDLGSLNQQIARLGEMPRGRRHVQSHSSSVVHTLQSRLATMSVHFKEVLEVRSENLRLQNSRREQFTRGPPPPRGPAALLEDDQVKIDLEGVVESEGRRMQRTLTRDETDDYVAQRAETMHSIESTIVELGGIFQQLAHMVKEQDEMVTRIDANVEDAELNVEAAHTQILKYFQSVTGNRMLMFKVFGVLIFFFIFFAIFLT